MSLLLPILMCRGKTAPEEEAETESLEFTATLGLLTAGELTDVGYSSFMGSISPNPPWIIANEAIIANILVTHGLAEPFYDLQLVLSTVPEILPQGGWLHSIEVADGAGMVHELLEAEADYNYGEVEGIGIHRWRWGDGGNLFWDVADDEKECALTLNIFPAE